jgi:hypothetical protein
MTCLICNANVEHEDPLPLSTNMDSEQDDFLHTCRGQGKKFLTFHKDTPRLVPPGVNKDAWHFNFFGIYKDRCCYCALHGGLSKISFADIGCYHCKRREALRAEFSRLKIIGREKHIFYGKTVWDRHGWAGLSDVLIDHILVFALELLPASSYSTE